MSEQEERLFVERLKRIWRLDSQLAETETWDIRDGRFGIAIPVQRDIKFFYADNPAGLSAHAKDRCILALSRKEDNALTGHLRYFAPDGEIRCYHEDGNALFEQFSARWLPFFRRGCWLSGCRIEASAHEKAEWMQGFAREEIEAWNLTF